MEYVNPRNGVRVTMVDRVGGGRVVTVSDGESGAGKSYGTVTDGFRAFQRACWAAMGNERPLSDVVAALAVGGAA